MMGIYGTQWTSQFGDVPTQDWYEALLPFSGQVVDMALGRCCQRESRFPPNLPEFLSICRWCRDDWQRHVEWREASSRPAIEDASDVQGEKERLREFVIQFRPIMLQALNRGLDLPDLHRRCRVLFDAGESLEAIVREVGLGVQE
ncbi:MAG: hypothetical protein HQL79_06135 [Magnetococcales bacterium]|nr:hypothetical protein [Magnetococcales bacterium]